MFGIGFGELVVIGVLAFIFIGPKRLPELAQKAGQLLRTFQSIKQGVANEVLTQKPASAPSSQQIKPDTK